MAILAFHEVADQRLAVGVLFVGLAPSAAKSSAKIVQHEICVLVGFPRHDRGRATHTQNSKQAPFECSVTHRSR